MTRGAFLLKEKNMDQNKIKECLEQYGYPSMVSSFYTKTAMNFEPELREAFERFLETGKPQDFSYHGWTLEKVMAHTFSEPPYTYFYFDKMMKNAEYAEYFKHMRFGRK